MINFELTIIHYSIIIKLFLVTNILLQLKVHYCTFNSHTKSAQPIAWAFLVMFISF